MLYPQWLIADIEFPEGSLEAHLSTAAGLLPAGLFADSGGRDEFDDCMKYGRNHFAMDTLQAVGRWAADSGRGAEVPSEYWLRVASAAHLMNYPQCVPYCLGKARGLPQQDPADCMAGFATLPRVAKIPGELHDPCGEVARIMRADTPEIASTIETADLDGLARHLRGGAFDRIGPDVSPLFSEAFDQIFTVVCGASIPAEHAAHSWAIIGNNPFEIILEGGLMPLTRAEVWWRA